METYRDLANQSWTMEVRNTLLFVHPVFIGVVTWDDRHVGAIICLLLFTEVNKQETSATSSDLREGRLPLYLVIIIVLACKHK